MPSKIIVAILCLVPFFAYASCSETEGSAWIIDTKTNKTLEKVDGGQITECANASGGFENFEKGDFSIGLAICNENCQDGFKEGSLYVRIKGQWKEGQILDEKDHDTTCIQADKDRYKYCWKVVR